MTSGPSHADGLAGPAAAIETMPGDEPTLEEGTEQGQAEPASEHAVGLLAEIDEGRYEIEEHLASGGGGRIDAARDIRLGRRIALKQAHRDEGERSVGRLVREAFLTARLQHPNIVPVYEAGRLKDQPLFSMRLVPGRPLSELLGETRTTADRIALLPHLIDVAEAIAYAHTQGVVHRDLKPANVLVGEFGETVVIDWGLAKSLDQPDEPIHTPIAGQSHEVLRDITMAGSIVGTPSYMPPEQARGEAVDEAADVYALGAIAYHMLGGTAPYGAGSNLEILGAVLTGPPPRLSERDPGLPQELLAIVDKAMGREPSLRYPSARELAEDLRRFQAGRLVQAHRYTTTERVVRALRKHKAAVAVAGVALIAVFGLAVYSYLSIRAERQAAIASRDAAVVQRRRAETAGRESEAARRSAERTADALRLEQARAAATEDPNEALRLLRNLSASFDDWGPAQVIASHARDRGLARVLGNCDDQPEPCVPGGAVESVLDPDRRRLVVLDDDGGLHVGEIDRFPRVDPVALQAPLTKIAHGPQSDRLAAIDRDRNVRIIDMLDGDERVLGRLDHAPARVYFPKAKWVLTLDESSELRAWPVDGGPSRVLQRCTRLSIQSAARVAVSGDGRRVLCPGISDMHVYDLETNEHWSTPVREPPLQSALDHDGAMAALNVRGSNLLWDVSSGRVQRLRDGPKQATAIAFDRSSTSLASAGYTGDVWIWNLEEDRLRPVSVHSGEVYDLSFSSDGTQLVSAGRDGRVNLRSLSGATAKAFVGPLRGIRRALFTASDSHVVASCGDGSIRLWPVQSSSSRQLAQLEAEVRAMELLPDGNLVLGTKAGEIAIVDTAKGGALSLGSFGSRAEWIGASTSGRHVAAFNDHDHVAVWRIDRDEPLEVARMSLPKANGPFEFIGDRALMWASRPGRVYELDLSTLEHTSWRAHPKTASGLRILGDGRIVTWSIDGTAILWRDRTEVARIEHDDEIWTAFVSPDERWLVTSGRDETLKFFDLQRNRVVYEAPDTARVVDLHFIDPNTMLTISLDDVVRRWGVSPPKVEQEYVGHAGYIFAIAVRAGHPRFASGSNDRTIRIWDIESGEGRPLHTRAGSATAVQMLSDGSIVTGSSEGEVRLWVDDVPAQPKALRAWLDRQVSSRLED